MPELVLAQLCRRRKIAAADVADVEVSGQRFKGKRRIIPRSNLVLSERDGLDVSDACDLAVQVLKGLYVLA